MPLFRTADKTQAGYFIRQVLQSEGKNINNSFWQNISIKNNNGLQLSALLRDSGSSNIIIVCHGFTGSKEGGGRALEMGDVLADRHFSTLLFDFAGCGKSEGSWHDISLTRQTEDLQSAVGWCREQGYAEIILTGRSFGGSTAINYAANDRSIKGICTWAAVARLTELFNKFAGGKITGTADDLVPISGEDGTVYLKKGFFYDLNKHDLLSSAGSISPRKLLIIHGSADQSVPVEDARLLYQAAAEPKQLEVIAGADHRFSNHIEAVWKAFFDWLANL